MGDKVHSYRLSRDVCANCGKMGGLHYSDNGISWCFPPATRRREENNPSYQTSFSYNKCNMDKSNPNKTFRKEV